MSKISIKSFLENLEKGVYDTHKVNTLIEAGWYDWFCRDSSLKNKTLNLGKKLKQISKSPKIDIENHYVYFKNNCPVWGNLYDSFGICDIKSGDIIFNVVPKSGHKIKNGKSLVWGKENDFEEPLVEGTWKDVKNYFLANID